MISSPKGMALCEMELTESDIFIALRLHSGSVDKTSLKTVVLTESHVDIRMSCKVVVLSLNFGC